jgi:hypothetical protein
MDAVPNVAIAILHGPPLRISVRARGTLAVWLCKLTLHEHSAHLYAPLAVTVVDAYILDVLALEASLAATALQIFLGEEVRQSAIRSAC